LGYYLGREEDFAAGVGGDDYRNVGGRRQLLGRVLTAGTYWNIERLGHLYIPVALSIESHGGDLLGFDTKLEDLLGAWKV
jgi:hypothetical protein